MKKIDFFVIGFLLLIALILGAVFYLPSEKGSGVIVRSEGGKQRISFTKEGEYEFKGVTLCIEGGKAWIKQSDCPLQYCKNRGKISRKGERIICLPNKLTVTVYGKSSDGDPDFRI